MKRSLKECEIALDVLKTFHRHSEIWRTFKISTILENAQRILRKA